MSINLKNMNDSKISLKLIMVHFSVLCPVSRKSKEFKQTLLKSTANALKGNPNESCEIWKQHYSKLYIPADSTSFDKNFTNMLKTIYMNMRERREMPVLMR